MGASVRGTSHVRNETACQDAHRWTHLADGTLIAAVADGAGSARYGEIGATVASRTCVEAIVAARAIATAPWSDGVWRTTIIDSIKACTAAVQAEAHARRVTVRDLATTLLIVVATNDAVYAAQIGDGAVVVDLGNELLAVTGPKGGEYLNETTFIVSPDAMEQVQFQAWHGEAAHIGMFSDGLQMLALNMPAATPYPPFFAPLFGFISRLGDNEMEAKAQLTQFLGSPRITERTDDDLTLLLAARKR